MPQAVTLDCSDHSAGTTPQDEFAAAASPPRCAALARCAHTLPRPALQLHRARNNHTTVIARNCQRTESHDSHCNSETARVPPWNMEVLSKFSLSGHPARRTCDDRFTRRVLLFETVCLLSYRYFSILEHVFGFISICLQPLLPLDAPKMQRGRKTPSSHTLLACAMRCHLYLLCTRRQLRLGEPSRLLPSSVDIQQKM